jgi:hypothetical protein
MSDESPLHAPAAAVPGPPASSQTALDRTARALRGATDAAAIGFLVYCTLLPELRTHGVVATWIASLSVFPYPRIAEHLRRQKDASVQLGLLLAGAALIALGILGHREWGIGRTALLGLMLVMVSWSLRLFVKGPPGEPVSLTRLLVGVGALASGALYLWLGVHASS